MRLSKVPRGFLSSSAVVGELAAVFTNHLVAERQTAYDFSYDATTSLDGVGPAREAGMPCRREVGKLDETGPCWNIRNPPGLCCLSWD